MLFFSITSMKIGTIWWAIQFCVAPSYWESQCKLITKEESNNSSWDWIDLHSADFASRSKLLHEWFDTKLKFFFLKIVMKVCQEMYSQKTQFGMNCFMKTDEDVREIKQYFLLFRFLIVSLKTTRLDNRFHYFILQDNCWLEKFLWHHSYIQDGLFCLKNIVFDAQPGDLICIIGAVGAGKVWHLSLALRRISIDA